MFGAVSNYCFYFTSQATMKLFSLRGHPRSPKLERASISFLFCFIFSWLDIGENKTREIVLLKIKRFFLSDSYKYNDKRRGCIAIKLVE